MGNRNIYVKELDKIVSDLENLASSLEHLDADDIYDLIVQNALEEQILEKLDYQTDIGEYHTDDLIEELERRDEGNVALVYQGLDMANQIAYDFLEGKVLFTDKNAELRFKQFFDEITGRSL